MLIDRILAYCREADYVTEEQAPWVRYILEKNITTVCGTIPFLLFAVVLTSWETVLARNHSVYPTSGTDTYENIQCRVTNTSGTTISVGAPHTLNETSATSTTITLGEGYLGYTSIVFGFRGNSSKPGEAVVSYNSR